MYYTLLKEILDNRFSKYNVDYCHMCALNELGLGRRAE